MSLYLLLWLAARRFWAYSQSLDLYRALSLLQWRGKYSGLRDQVVLQPHLLNKPELCFQEIDVLLFRFEDGVE